MLTTLAASVGAVVTAFVAFYATYRIGLHAALFLWQCIKTARRK